MNLFIIGNGFDIVHKLNTRYNDFKKYLLSHYPGSSEEVFVVFETIIGKDGEEFFDEKDVASFLLRTISIAEGGLWKDLENTLGNLDFGDYFEEIDYNGEKTVFKQIYNNEDVSNNLILPTLTVKRFFTDWIKTIDVEKAKSIDSIKNLINPQRDLFLNFNYTNTLEYIYNVNNPNNICHIHGEANNEIIFGHGNNIENQVHFMSSYLGTEGAISTISMGLFKNTQLAYERNQGFFDRINSELLNIYVYGFSFSDIDLLYIKEICKRATNPKLRWYLHNHNRDKHNIFRKKIVDCGYKGAFNTYNA